MRIIRLAVLAVCAPVVCVASSQLVDITTLIAGITIDCVYATTRNFTGKQIYRKPICYLLKPIPERLVAGQNELEKKGAWTISLGCVSSVACSAAIMGCGTCR